MPRKVLLDENLPRKLRAALFPHTAMTVHSLGWAGKSDEDLLTAAEHAGFEVLLTGDQNLVHQQSMRGRKIAVVTLNSLDWHMLLEAIGIIYAAIEDARPGSVGLVALIAG